jgi:hypothetical protein
MNTTANPGFAVNYPLCGAPLVYLRTDADTHVYRCPVTARSCCRLMAASASNPLESMTPPPSAGDPSTWKAAKKKQAKRHKSTMTTSRFACCFALCLIFTGCVLPSTRRVHAENMAKAEAFKREFDKHLPAGASRAEVDEYLAAHQLKIGNLLGPDGTGDGLLELFTEKSISWYCGQGIVGLHIHFTANRLDNASTGSWSWDCP